MAAWAVGNTLPADLGLPLQAPVLSRGKEATQIGKGVVGGEGSESVGSGLGLCC